MKIVIFGCQQIAVDIIKHIIELGKYEIPLVITYELPLDETYGYESVSATCKNLNIEYISTTDNPTHLIERIKSINPDLIFSLYYRRIIPASIFSLAKNGAFNIHPSKLPFYRGPVPTMWAIQNGEKSYGVTIHEIDDGIDTGDILYQEEYPIEPDDTGHSLYLKAMNNACSLFLKNLDNIASKKYNRTKQVGYGSYYGKYNGKSFINWASSAIDIINFIRARSKPFNPAQTSIYNSYICINKASLYKDDKLTAITPGKIVRVFKDGKFAVSCADGCVILDDFEIYPPLNHVTKKVYMQVGNKLK